jgi:hypothetical protein
VVSDETDVGALLDDRRHLVRARAVADEVAQAPDAVGRVRVDRLENRFERV